LPYSITGIIEFESLIVDLQKSGIPVPLHIIVDRDALSGNEKDPSGFIETEDYVELNGTVSDLANRSHICLSSWHAVC